MKAAQRPIAFVALRDEVFATRVPMRVVPKNGNFGADVM